MGDSRKRLAEKMDLRRAELRLKWKGVAELANVDESTLHRVRTNKIALSIDVKTRIEQALEWKTGSVDAILADQEPTPKEPPPPVKPMLLDKIEEALWAITELSEGMRWDHILAHRAGKDRRGDEGDAGNHRQSGS